MVTSRRVATIHDETANETSRTRGAQVDDVIAAACVDRQTGFIGELDRLEIVYRHQAGCVASEDTAGGTVDVVNGVVRARCV